MTTALDIKNLSLSIQERNILRDVSLQLKKGEITGLVGRSGSGKSLTAFSVMGLAPRQAHTTGEVIFKGQNLLSLTEETLSRHRGKNISMIFQEPLTALNPVQSIETQVSEIFCIHERLSRKDAVEKAHAALEKAGLPPSIISPKRFPHELSGGQRQRALIAAAIALKPTVLLADEPTTALDVTTQAEILDRLHTLCREDGIAVLLISHDLGVVAQYSDTLAIMSEGAIVEHSSRNVAGAAGAGLKSQEFKNLTAPLPVRETRKHSPKDVILSVNKLHCEYPGKSEKLFSRADPYRAVEDVSFKVRPGESFGVIGESGSGKSTLARTLLGLHQPTQGSIAIDGRTVVGEGCRMSNEAWRKTQIVFQDPYSSFNPRHSVERIVGEPLHLLENPPTGPERRKRVEDALLSVGLEASHADRFPDAFSGGQRQRIAIARALAVEPKIIVFDEATSALDIISRNKILTLLANLRHNRNVSYIFVSHDMNIIRHVCDRVAVMKDGKFIEMGDTQTIFEKPTHDYTKKLVAAAASLQSALDALTDLQHAEAE
ncbi:MAG: ABC transporter ATP-binding protein [Pseudomonadota bacterium]